jgi:hypothetical protein
MTKRSFCHVVSCCPVTVKRQGEEQFKAILLGKIPSQTMIKSNAADAARGGDDDTTLVGAFTI